MEEIKEELNKIQKILIEKFNPLAIILFGSFARGTQNLESDIDIAIVSKNNNKKDIFEIKQELEEIVSRDVDLVNITDTNISEGFRYEILMNGIVLYCQDEYKFDMYKIAKCREYLDFNENIDSSNKFSNAKKIANLYFVKTISGLPGNLL